MKKLLFSVIFLFVCNYVNSQNYFGTSTNSVNSNFDLSHLGTFTLGSTFESMNDPWRAGEGRLLELYKPSGNVSFKLGNAFGKLSFNIAGHNGAFFPSAQNGDIVIRKHSSKKVYFSLNTSNGTGDSAFIFGDSSNRQTLSILNNGKVGVGTTNPLEKLHINGSIRGNIGTGALRIKSGSGYIDVGALNTSYAHIYTDRPKIIFNKDVYTTTNAFSSYSSDLILKTAGSEKFRIKRSNCFVGIGTTNPSGKLHVKGETYIDGGWLRVLGNQGLYFQNHGGGLFMQDATWIRTYGNKSFYHNTGIMRTDGTFQVGSSGNRFLVKTDGKIGIGITNPSEKLDVNGSILSRANIKMNGTDFQLGLNNSRDKGTKTSQRALVHYTEDRLVVNYGGDFEGGVQISGPKTIIDGNVGIGTRNPDEKLTVAGNIHAEEVRVDLEVPPDYVFQKYYTGTSSLKDTYKMATLKEVEAFTKKNHHLPEVPSAKEIKENGLNLKQMTALLLQKVEELTLYTIEQEKRIKMLEKKIIEKEN